MDVGAKLLKARNPFYLCKNLTGLEKTLSQFDHVISKCRSLFAGKTRDYGTSWRIMRLSSLTDQLMIKAKRIRNLEEMAGNPQVNEGVEGEYVGLVNYSVMALMQLKLDKQLPLELPYEQAIEGYEQTIADARALMQRKNHDYGEAWRELRMSSITDLILAKLLRIKQIEDNQGKTEVSEGLAGHYNDILIYAVFALIRLQESQT